MAIHDEVLARLLKLNQERADAEKLGRTPRRKEPAKAPTAKQLDLIPPNTKQLDLL